MNKKIKKAVCVLSIATALSLNTASALELIKLPTEMLQIAGTSLAKEAEVAITWDYTYEELLEKALKRSRDLKKSEMMMERAEILKDDASFDMTQKGRTDSTYVGFRRLDVELKKAEKRVDTLKEQISHDVKTTYYDILKNEDNKKIIKLKVDILNEKNQHAKLKYEYGTISEIEKKQAQRDYEEAKKQYKLVEKELEKSYEVLNDLVGLEVKERYILKDDLTFDEIEDDDVDAHIATMISKSPEIWGLEKEIDLADLGVRLYTFNVGAAPYDAKEIDVKTAEITLGSKKQEYDKTLRTTYNSLNQIKDEYEKAKISYETAKDQLNKTKLYLDTGKVAPIAVTEVELQLENTKQQLRGKIMDYNKLVMTYNKPWIR